MKSDSLGLDNGIRTDFISGVLKVVAKTVYVFSRRCIQRMLDSLTEAATAEQLRHWANRLNRPGDDRLACVWEIAIVYALCQEGNVKHEHPLPNRSTPDVLFTFQGEHKPSLVMEVTVVSDRGFHDRNPVEYFDRELVRIAGKVGIEPNKISFQIFRCSDSETACGCSITALPENKSSITRLLTRNALPFLRAVKNSAATQDAILVKEGGSHFSISYNANQRFMGGSYPGYTVADSIEQTPLYGALRSKAKKLKAAPTDYVTAVVACNGGCSVFKGHNIFGRNILARDVAKEVLRQYSSLGFILMIDAIKPFTTSPTDRPFAYLKYELVFGDRFRGDQKIVDLVSRTMAVLPSPMNDALNASYRSKEVGYGIGYVGGFKMSRKSIRLSSRAVVELLAGRITPEHFAAVHGWDRRGDSGHINFFEHMLSQGRMISETTVTRTDDDDDWLTFQFGDPDPAISPFRPPVVGV